ncbi:flagellar filament capping protein FliD [Sphingobium boeckii]|uniref:Flagellar hook-associated protein 2 n=1 Tax=Sphingobium boeckii TaxID=1082345 RepID=A0A7W9AJ44_9SPHN|nr:flagellar filament capping protein FliD [Sphingobium boeckii]MBB5686439.1 flagellar hook-associated protein 2 [Sphingobium boeckii]
MVTSISAAMGVGSGIDTVQLIEDLANASKAPKEAQITARETANTAKISSVGSLASAIDSFASALTTLISGGTLFTQPTSSDTSILTTTMKPGAHLSGLSANIEVVQLATAQSLASGSIADTAAPIGVGTFTLTTGKGAFNVTVDANNNSLSGLSAAINAANAGVTSSIVSDGNGGSRLIIRGTTGAAQAFTMVPQAGADASLSQFAYAGVGSTGGLTQAQAAQDAIIKLDGIAISRATNSFSDVLPGVTIDLKKASVGTVVGIGSSRQTDALKQAVEDYVAAYNSLETMLDEATAPADSDGANGGPLRGNSAIRDMRTKLAAMSAMKLRSGDGPTTLAEIGVRTARDGSLSVDTARLDAALANSPDAVEELFNPSQKSDNPLVSISSAPGLAKPGTYVLTNLVPGINGGDASGMINGVAATASGNTLFGAIGTLAAGLAFQPLGTVASATITVDLGLGGALKAVRDALRSTTGPLVTMQDRLKKEAEMIGDDREKMEMREDAFRARLEVTFTAMERRVAAFKATQSYLEQQIKMWTNDD